MSERIPCEFSLIRYVPDVVKGEFTNIGVVLREARHEGARNLQSASRAVTEVRFTRDWRRVRCIDPDADTDLLESIEEEIASLLIAEASGPPPSKPLMALLADTLSNSVQITEPRACLAETFTLQLEELLRLYVEPLRVKLQRDRKGRAAITATLRSEFERAGVWGAMFKRFPVAPYTRKGDPLKIDCGYTANGTMHLFHAVSLGSDAEAARGLSYCAPLLNRGLLRKDNLRLDLAAVIEPIRDVSPERGKDNDFTDEAADLYKFGVGMMEDVAIRVLTLNDIPRAAETIRGELGL